mmetsp:Transcript_14500/g.16022  ORF Transcript_14500/g.16022 Transcript_14500/m.16022 type:complete len:329 (-) Transcript_14500:529-1515(-)
MHTDDNTVSGADQIHGTSHTTNHLTRNHPRGKISVSSNFETSQEGNIQMGSSDHTEGVGTGDGNSSGAESDCLFTGVNKIRINIFQHGVGSHTQQTVLTLDLNINILFDPVGNQSGDTDTQIDVHAIGNFLGGPSGDHFSLFFVMNLTTDFDSVFLSEEGMLLDSLLIHGGFDNSVNIDTGGMDIISFQLSGFNDVLSFGNSHFTGTGHINIEVTGSQSVNEVTLGISLVGFDETEVGSKGRDEQISLAVKFSHFSLGTVFGNGAIFVILDNHFTLFEPGSSTGGGIESGDTESTTTKLFGEGTLGDNIAFHFTSKVGLDQILVFSHK